VFGVATIPLVYALGKMLFDKKTGLMAALLFGFSSYQVYYAQEARLYALTGLLAVLATYFFARLFTGKGKVWSWVGYGVSAAACVYTFYYLVFLLAAHGVALGVWWMVRGGEERAGVRKLAVRWVACMGCVAAISIPLVPVVLRRMAEAKGGALEYARETGLGGWVIPNVFREFAHGFLMPAERSIYLFYLAVALVPLVAAHKWVKEKLAGFVLLDAWMVVPLALVAILPIKIHVFESKHLLFVSPAAYLLAAFAITRARVWGAVLVALLVLTNLSWYMVYFHPNFEKEDWREVASAIREGVRERDAIYMNPAWLTFPLRRYWEEDPGVRIYANPSPERRFDRAILDDMLSYAERVWLVEEFSRVVGPDKETSDYLKERLPVHEKVLDEDYFMGSIRVWLLEGEGDEAEL